MPPKPTAFAAPADDNDLFSLSDFVGNPLLAGTLVGFTAKEDVVGSEVRFGSMSDARGLLNADELTKGFRFFGSRRDRTLTPMVMGPLETLEKLVADAQPRSVVDLLAPTDDLPAPSMLKPLPRRQSSHRDLS